ncbi:alpha/beta hydrolase domain-containing protein [Nocardia sp. alder85J]|uniref:alpha/beta hydrolase domain-containing protein n=1 Tax=Nocardia sp. alder85J TaxID=2862949 RepID=UPI001CD63D74|nr:alpha/beta hydrolase domain-containing protein [Nocardia sp. alder85J]MCX4096922.1 alpha/beta hydrolase domain-containing protein [Nocardia sp. alder85J]
MAVEAVRIEAVQPYADPRYEMVRGTAGFAVDPAHPANARIIDLALAPRGGDGLVRFDSDLRILRPTGTGSRNLLLLVPNRGMIGGLPFSTGLTPDYTDFEKVSPGDGFLLDRGWTVVWCGWQWDILRGPGQLGLTAPEAAVEPGAMRLEWRGDIAEKEHPLADSMPGLGGLFRFAEYPTADVADPAAVLTVRTAPDAEPVEIPRSAWRFTDPTHIALDGGFEPFRWYRLVYRTSRAPVAGCGLLAIRDLVAHLRAGGFEHTFAYGISQSGRFLRQFLWEGMNLDESGRQVFDGVFADRAGAHRGEFNHRYAQPSVTQVDGFGTLPPFDSASLLARQRALGGMPKIVQVNTAAEYWRGDTALAHIDADTGADLPEDPDVRMYAVAGTDHLPPMGAMKGIFPAANPPHDLDMTPVLRALLVALEQWVRGRSGPPDSRVPRVGDGTAVPRATALGRFAHAHRPDPGALAVPRHLDLGPEADRGIGRWPARLGAPYPALVSSVDEDGNEIAGIHLPAVAAPLAVYTGWNPRRPTPGLPDVVYERLGSRVDFPPGRPSAAERWPTVAAYRTAVAAAADRLVAARLLLPQDRTAVVAAAVAEFRSAVG